VAISTLNTTDTFNTWRTLFNNLVNEHNSGSTTIVDGDEDTKIQVEESSDEDIIRFDTGGTERVTISAAGVVAIIATTANTSATDGALTVAGGAGIAADLSVGDDLRLISDSSVLSFGADSDVTITHDPDDGLFLKSTATADDNPIVLTLQTGETDIAANDVIGTINFQAPDEGTGTDAILVAAGIEAISEGDFSSSANATKLSFKTAASEAAAEKMSLSSAGLLTVTDDLVIKSGGTIGGAGDTDLLTLGSAALTVAGTIAGTAITASGVLKTDDTTEATTTTDGSLQTDGGLSVVKDAVFGDDVKLLSDDAVLSFGADQDVKITHDPDDGLLIKSTATADDNPLLITLQTGETDLAADDVIGKIAFQAPDEGTGTDAILVSAAIQAIAEGDHSSSSNATTLSFMTGASEAAAAKLNLTSGGDVKVLTDGASMFFGADSEIELRHVADDGLIIKHVGTGDGKEPSLTFQAGDNDIAADDVLGSIFFQAPDEGAGTDAVLVAAGLEAVSEGDFSSSSNATSLHLKTGASEAATSKVKVRSDGGVTLTTALGSSSNSTASTLYSDNIVKAWCNATGTGTAAIQDDHNVASITDNGTGDYTFAIGLDMANANYACVSSLGATSNCFPKLTITASTVRIESLAAGGDPSIVLTDTVDVMFVILGENE